MSLAAINVETFRSCAGKSLPNFLLCLFFSFFFQRFSSLFLEAKPPQRYLRLLSHFLIFKICFPILSFFFQSQHPIKTFMSTPTHLDQKHLRQPKRQGKTKTKRDHLPRPRSADVPGPRACVEPGRPRADVPGPRVCAGFSLSDPRALSGWPLLGSTAPPTFLLVPPELH